MAGGKVVAKSCAETAGFGFSRAIPIIRCFAECGGWRDWKEKIWIDA